MEIARSIPPEFDRFSCLEFALKDFEVVVFVAEVDAFDEGGHVGPAVLRRFLQPFRPFLGRRVPRASARAPNAWALWTKVERQFPAASGSVQASVASTDSPSVSAFHCIIDTYPSITAASVINTLSSLAEPVAPQKLLCYWSFNCTI